MLKTINTRGFIYMVISHTKRCSWNVENSYNQITMHLASYHDLTLGSTKTTPEAGP